MGMAVMHEPPAPLPMFRADIPADIEQLVVRCLEKSPDDRFQDANALAEAVRACQRRSAPGSPGVDQPITLSSSASRRSSAVTKVWVSATGIIALVVVTWAGAHLKRPD